MSVFEWVLLAWSIGTLMVLVFTTWAWLKEKSDKLSTGWGLIIVLFLSIFWFISIPLIIRYNKKSKLT